MTKRRSRVARMIDTALTLDEFIDVFAPLVPHVPKDVFAMLIRQASPDDAAVIQGFLAPFGALVYQKRHKILAKGWHVPPRFLAEEAPAEKAPEAYTHEELLAIFRPAWAEYQRAVGSSAS